MVSSFFQFPGLSISEGYESEGTDQWFDMIEQAVEFDHWFNGLGGKGRYVGNTLVLENGQVAEPEDLIIFEDNQFRVLKKVKYNDQTD